MLSFVSVDSITILGTGAKWIATLEDRDIQPGKVSFVFPSNQYLPHYHTVIVIRRVFNVFCWYRAFAGDHVNM